MSLLLRTLHYYALYSLITIGTILRVISGANSELRFDELISLELISRILSPWEILFTLHHDNNHPLASLIIFFIGVRKYYPGICYRAIPILSSLISAILLALILIKRAKSPLPAIIGSALFSSSLLSITLSSEIRGYSFSASAAFFAFFLHYSSRRDIFSITGFNLICCIGFISHATFILFFTALGTADLLLILLKSPNENRKNSLLLVCERYAFPGLFLIVLYLIFYKNLPPVSAPLTPWLDTVASTLSLSIGGPWISLISRPIYIIVWMYAGAASLILIQSLRYTVQFRSHILHLLFIILIMPFIAIVSLSPQAIAERYLYLPVLFSFLPVSEFLVYLMPKSGWKRFGGFAITTLILGGNLIHSGCFLLYGNGRMHDLIKYCEENSETKDSPLQIAGDHYLRIGLPLKRLTEEYPNLQIHYSELIADRNHEISADWIISHYVDRAYIPPPIWQSPHGEKFYLVRTFPNYSLNSWPLFLYRKTKEIG